MCSRTRRSRHARPTIGLLLAAMAILGADLPTEPCPPLPREVTAEIHIHAGATIRPVSPWFIGTNLTHRPPDMTQIGEIATQERIRGLGIKTVRFPNGCLADLYDWQSPTERQLAVEGFLDFCDTVGAEAYYTLNLQGGTEGLEGPPPPDAPVEERIRYRHTAPNPCGYTNYHFGTLAEAIALVRKHTIERALAGRRPITRYELGNENWGQAKSDWPPEVYGRTCEVFARTLRQLVADARRNHPQLADLELYIVMVGFPSSGNNQDPFQATDREINLAWTAEVNRLADLGLIDAVQEHFYADGNADGSTLYWVVHNLHNILALRHGRPNERLGGYRGEGLAYRVPVEITEWNVKCWGKAPQVDLPLANPGFEDGLSGWTVEAHPPGSGSATTTASAARRGAAGLLLETGPQAEWVEVRQKFSVAERMPAPLFGCGAWVRGDHPLQTHVMLRQANAGEGQGKVIVDRVATQLATWERMVVAGPPLDDTTELEVAFRLEGPGRRAAIDEGVLIHWPTLAGVMPLAADRFEQQLFIVDALRELLNWPTPRTHFHHLFGNYPCGTLQADGTEKPQARAFQLLHERIGDRVVRTDVEVPTFAYNTYADEWAGDFKALAPDMTNIPALSALTTRQGDDLYLLLINRTNDRAIKTRINLVDGLTTADVEVRTLSGTDLELPTSTLRTAAVPPGHLAAHTFEPLTAQVLRIVLQPPAKPRPDEPR